MGRAALCSPSNFHSTELDGESPLKLTPGLASQSRETGGEIPTWHLLPLQLPEGHSDPGSATQGQRK